MNSVCNPKQKRGKRNVFCNYYNKCLDHVIKRSWMDWDCSSCPQYSNQQQSIEILTTANDSLDVHELPYTISRRLDANAF